MATPIALEPRPSTPDAAVQARSAQASLPLRERSHEGFLDGISVADGCTLVEGWAWNSGRPDDPVEIEVLLDGKAIARERAGTFRHDLLVAGKGNGHHAFGAVIASAIDAGSLPNIDVRVAGTDFHLGKENAR